MTFFMFVSSICLCLLVRSGTALLPIPSISIDVDHGPVLEKVSSAVSEGAQILQELVEVKPVLAGPSPDASYSAPLEIIEEVHSAPEPVYSAPVEVVEEFSAPEPVYSAPVEIVEQFSAPEPVYSAPVEIVEQFSAPGPDYSAPVEIVEQYSAPEPVYSAPELVEQVSSPFQNFVSTSQQVCPLRVNEIWEEAVVQQAVHQLVTVTSRMTVTQYQFVTDTIEYPVTVVVRSTVTAAAQAIPVTDTVVVEEDIFVTRARIETVQHTITQTALAIETETLYNTIVVTELDEVVVTQTSYSTYLQTTYSTIVTHNTIWETEVETVTQPVYVTTNLWVEAPQLELVTSTEYVPKYVTRTTTVTQALYTTICTEKGYY